MILKMAHVAQYDAQNAISAGIHHEVFGGIELAHLNTQTITEIWKAKGKSLFNFMDGLIRLYHHTVKDMNQ